VVTPPAILQDSDTGTGKECQDACRHARVLSGIRAACSPTTRVFQAAVPVRWHPSLTESVGECTDGGGVLADAPAKPHLSDGRGR
jgi:hypothetical protein